MARRRRLPTTGRGVFTGLPDPLEATRYHSLVVDPGGIPPASRCRRGAARTGRSWGSGTGRGQVEGVQFHPESILTEGGHRLLANWLAACGQPGALAAIPAS